MINRHEVYCVLFTVFNRKDKTLCCLERLYAQLPIEGCQLDVFLTDDGCTDGTPGAVAARFPNVSIVRGAGAYLGIVGCGPLGKRLQMREIMTLIFG